MQHQDTTAAACGVRRSKARAVEDRLRRARLNARAERKASCPLSALFLREQQARDYLGAVHGWAREDRHKIALEPGEALRIAAEIAEGNAR